MKIESLVPTAISGIASGDEFMARLPEFDDHFDKMRKEAAGSVLRYVGVIDVQGGQVRAGLER